MDKILNGSDALYFVGEQAAGHSTSGTLTLSSETKERAFKPAASVTSSQSTWKHKGIVGQSFSMQVEGLIDSAEAEAGYKVLFAAWKAHEPVTVMVKNRGATSPFLKGSAVITSLERTDPAQDDSTWSASFENDGAPDTLDADAIEALPNAESNS